MAKILEQLADQRAAMMEFRMKNGNHWARLLAYVTLLINQELLLQNEYPSCENRILRAHLPARLRLSDPERCTLAEIGRRLGRKALEKVPAWPNQTPSSPGTGGSLPASSMVPNAVPILGIENSKSLGMVAPGYRDGNRCRNDHLGLGNVREQALSWKVGTLLGERMRNGPASESVASRGASFVTMVKTADLRDREHSAQTRRMHFRWFRRVFSSDR
jgi:hypothetical protein